MILVKLTTRSLFSFLPPTHPGERGARECLATELAVGRAPLVLLQALRELDEPVDTSTETQWSCGDAIAMLRASVWKAFSEGARKLSSNRRNALRIRLGFI